MAIRLYDSGGDYLTRAVSTLNYNADYTVAWWIYTTADAVNSWPVEISDASSSNRDTIRFDTAEKLRLYSYAAGSAQIAGTTGATTVTDGWHRIALVRSGQSLTVYLDGASEIAASNTNIADVRTSASTQMRVGYSYQSTGDQGEEGHFGMKVFTRALTLAELTREWATNSPHNRTSLYAWYPCLLDSTRADDYSGNGRHWTEVGSSVANIEGPDVAWGPQGPIFTEEAAGGGVTVTPTTLALTLATFAPTVSTPVTATPTTLALTTSLFAPTVSTPRTVTPSTLEMVTATFAPTIETPVVTTPTTLALVTTAYEPTVTATENQTVTPTTLALALTPFAPDVGTSGSVVPSTTALTLTTFAPYSLIVGTDSASVAVITTGLWNPPVTLEDGDQWKVLLFGPSADAPKVRVTLRCRML